MPGSSASPAVGARAPTVLQHQQQLRSRRRARLPSRASEVRDLSSPFSELAHTFLGPRWLCGRPAAVCRRWARASFGAASAAAVVRVALPRSSAAFAADDTRTTLPEWLYLPPSDFETHAHDSRMAVCRLRLDSDRRTWEQAWHQLWYEHLAFGAWRRHNLKPPNQTAQLALLPPPSPPVEALDRTSPSAEEAAGEEVDSTGGWGGGGQPLEAKDNDGDNKAARKGDGGENRREGDNEGGNNNSINDDHIDEENDDDTAAVGSSA